MIRKGSRRRRVSSTHTTGASDNVYGRAANGGGSGAGHQPPGAATAIAPTRTPAGTRAKTGNLVRSPHAYPARQSTSAVRPAGCTAGGTTSATSPTANPVTLPVTGPNASPATTATNMTRSTPNGSPATTVTCNTGTSSTSNPSRRTGGSPAGIASPTHPPSRRSRNNLTSVATPQEERTSTPGRVPGRALVTWHRRAPFRWR